MWYSSGFTKFKESIDDIKTQTKIVFLSAAPPLARRHHFYTARAPPTCFDFMQSVCKLCNRFKILWQYTQFNDVFSNRTIKRYRLQFWYIHWSKINYDILFLSDQYFYKI